jgi:ABC-2 type transport system ATP-binding protein
MEDVMAGFYSRYDESIYMEYLERFGLDRKIKFGKLSKGQKIKAQFAFALSTDPKYLILDEPTANFDPEFKQDFLNVIMQFMESGKKSVIIASHILDELDRIADYLIYLDKGELVYSGDIESFRDKYRIISGETYKVKLLKQEDIIHVEDRKYGTKALVVNHGYSKYDGALTVTVPTLEEFMYHYSKRGESVI